VSRSRLPFDFNMGPSEAQAALHFHCEAAGPCSSRHAQARYAVSSREFCSVVVGKVSRSDVGP